MKRVETEQIDKRKRVWRTLRKYTFRVERTFPLVYGRKRLLTQRRYFLFNVFLSTTWFQKLAQLLWFIKIVPRLHVVLFLLTQRHTWDFLEQWSLCLDALKCISIYTIYILSIKTKDNHYVTIWIQRKVWFHTINIMYSIYLFVVMMKNANQVIGKVSIWNKCV